MVSYHGRACVAAVDQRPDGAGCGNAASPWGGSMGGAPAGSWKAGEDQRPPPPPGAGGEREYRAAWPSRKLGPACCPPTYCTEVTIPFTRPETGPRLATPGPGQIMPGRGSGALLTEAVEMVTLGEITGAKTRLRR